MSETTTNSAPANLRAARKEQAAKAPAKTTAAKAPAKKAPAKKAAEPKAKPEDGTLYVYRATGRAGVVNTRTLPHPAVLAADVKDESHSSPRWKQGVITRMFATEAAAQKYAQRQRETGADVILVAVELVETKKGA